MPVAGSCTMGLFNVGGRGFDLSIVDLVDHVAVDHEIRLYVALGAWVWNRDEGVV